MSVKQLLNLTLFKKEHIDFCEPMGGMVLLKETEQKLHLRLAELLRRTSNHHVTWWHTNNNPKSAKDGARLKRMGMKAGIADFLFIKPTPAELFSLELKTETGRASPEQLDWRDYIRDIGWYAEIAYGWDHAIRILSAWEIIKVREV